MDTVNPFLYAATLLQFTNTKKKHENKTKQNWFVATFRDQNVDDDQKIRGSFFEFTVSITNQNL